MQTNLSVKYPILTVLCLAAWGPPELLGQAADQPVVLTIDMDNYVQYRGDVTDPGKISRDPGPTAGGPARAFQYTNHMADLVAVNGRPIKGSLWVAGSTGAFRVSPQAGQAIADFDGAGPYLNFWEILGPEGNWVGSLMGGGSFPPAPGNLILGGNGAFLGVTGEAHAFQTIAAVRTASVTEDPANRRLNGGGKVRTVVTLYPKYRPSVEVTTTGPAVFHEDFTPVTAARPARADEILIVRARNLGPTLPDLLPPGTRPFKADPPYEIVNSPLEVTVNGKETAVLNKLGWGGTYDLYRVDFRVPSGLAPGTATIQLTAAWIPGPQVEIPVQ